MRAIHPGEILKEEFMIPLGLSANALAQALSVPPNRITAIMNESRGITGDTALRLGTYFNASPEFWMNLQSAYDLRSVKLSKVLLRAIEDAGLKANPAIN